MIEASNVIGLPKVDELSVKISRRNDGAYSVKVVGDETRKWTIPAFSTDATKARIFSEVGDEIGGWLVEQLGEQA